MQQFVAYLSDGPVLMVPGMGGSEESLKESVGLRDMGNTELQGL